MLVTPSFGFAAPAKLPNVVVLVPRANAPKPNAVAPPDVPVVAPVATELMPHTTSCGFVADEPEPVCGSPPVALPPQTNCAAAGIGSAGIKRSVKGPAASRGDCLAPRALHIR